VVAASLTGFEDEKRQNDEEGGEGFSVFDIDNRLEVLTNEQLAYEDQGDVH